MIPGRCTKCSANDQRYLEEGGHENYYFQARKCLTCGYIDAYFAEDGRAEPIETAFARRLRLLFGTGYPEVETLADA